MNILYVGSLLPRKIISKYISKSIKNIDFATNNYQRAFLSSLFKTDNSVKAISCPFVKFLTNTKNDLLIKTDFESTKYYEFHTLLNTPIPVLRNVLELLVLSVYHLKFMYKKIDILIIFSLHTSFLIPSIV